MTLLAVVVCWWWYHRSQTRQVILYIQGNIGVGKSTLLERIAQEGFLVVPEPVELLTDCGVNFLELLYHDLGQWAFTFQILTLFTIWYARMKSLSSATITVTERCPQRCAYVRSTTIEQRTHKSAPASTSQMFVHYDGRHVQTKGGLHLPAK